MLNWLIDVGEDLEELLLVVGGGGGGVLPDICYTGMCRWGYGFQGSLS